MATSSRSKEEIMMDTIMEIVLHIEDRDNLDSYGRDRFMVDTFNEFKDLYHKEKYE